MPIQPYNRTYPTDGHERRSRYANDEGYRERVKRSSRSTYRRKNNVELETCLHSLEFVHDLAKECEVELPNGRIFTCPTLNVSKTASALQIMYQTVLRWIKTDMLPSPVLVSLSRQHHVLHVYHLDEVRVFIEEIGKHKKTVRYYRQEHVEVRDRIEQRVKAIRKTLGITTED